MPAADEAVAILTAAQDRTEAARRALDRIAEREEADRLSARLTRIGEIERDLDPVHKELSGIVLTEELLHRIELAAASVDRAGDQLEMLSAVVEFTAAADIELVVGDQRVSLHAGRSWSITATGPTDVEVAGVLTTRVTPGATALDVRAKYVAAQQEMAAALEAGGVADITAARSVHQRRRELCGSRDRLTATLAGLCGDEGADELRSRLARLQADQPAEPDLFATDTTQLPAPNAKRPRRLVRRRRRNVRPGANMRQPPPVASPKQPRGQRS